MSPVAFKEWNVIVEELLTGRQILILRKGGIHEKRGEFQLSHQEFFLFPTFLHQAEGNLKPELEKRLSLGTAPSETIQITGYAKVDWSEWVGDLSKLEKLDLYHGWSWECIQERAEWGDSKGLYVIAVRVYRLEKEISLKNDPKYGGCRSWVELGEGIQVPAMTPVLSDQEFQKRSDQIKKIISSH